VDQKVLLVGNFLQFKMQKIWPEAGDRAAPLPENTWTLSHRIGAPKSGRWSGGRMRSLLLAGSLQGSRVSSVGNWLQFFRYKILPG